MNAAIQDFINGKRIAVAGASRKGTKFGNAASKELGARGYQVYLIHPQAQEIDGQKCYPNLAALPSRVDGVLVSVPPGQAEGVLREAAGSGVRNVWLQAGAETPELLALANDLGLNLVSGKCILMYAQPVQSFHRWHRWFCQLTGQL